MRIKTRLIWLVILLCGSLVQAEDLAPATLAKILKLVAADAKETSIACTDVLVRLELMKLGVRVDQDSKIVWVKTAQDVAKVAGSPRLTISGQLADLQNGIIVALVNEGGHGVFYINLTTATANKVAIPPVLVKLGKVVQ